MYGIHGTWHNIETVKITLIVFRQPIIDWHNAIIVTISLMPITLHYSASHSFTVLPGAYILFCRSFFYYSSSHYYSIVPVTLILMYESPLHYYTSHVYTIVSVTLVLLHQNRNLKRWFKSNWHDSICMTGKIV